MNFSDYTIEFSEEKSWEVFRGRKASLEDIADLMKVRDCCKMNSRSKYPHQEVYAVEVEGYFWTVACVVDHDKKTAFLKTAWPDRNINAEMAKGGNNDEG